MISKRFFILPFIVLIIVSCASSSKENSSFKLKRKWMLVKMSEFHRDTLIKYGTYIDLTQSNEKGNAFMGCNQIDFNFRVISKKKMIFSNIISSEKYCLKTSEIESEFIKNITKVTRFSTAKAHKLELFDKTGKLQFEFIASDWD